MTAKDTLEKNGIMPSDLICSSQFDCILRSMEEYAKLREQQAWDAGRCYGVEQILWDRGFLESHECTAPDFEEWRNIP